MSRPPRRAGAETLVERYAVGIGMRPGTGAAAVRAVLDRVAAEHGVDLTGAVFATLASRADEHDLREALRAIVSDDVELIAWLPDELAGERVPHPSERVAAAVGTPSVAEAAAVRTARTFPGATGAALLVPKSVGDGVTVAIARPIVDGAR